MEQTYYENFAVFSIRFFKYVWPFFNIMKERVKDTQQGKERINLLRFLLLLQLFKNKEKICLYNLTDNTWI